MSLQSASFTPDPQPKHLAKSFPVPSGRIPTGGFF